MHGLIILIFYLLKWEDKKFKMKGFSFCVKQCSLYQLKAYNVMSICPIFLMIFPFHKVSNGTPTVWHMKHHRAEFNFVEPHGQKEMDGQQRTEKLFHSINPWESGHSWNIFIPLFYDPIKYHTCRINFILISKTF